MAKQADGKADDSQEYSEATRRVFEKVLTTVQKRLTEAQVDALERLLEKNQFHDSNELLKALRSGDVPSAD